LADGFVAVPVQFMAHYAGLKPFCLSLAEAMLVVQLMVFKWSAQAPFPGYKKLALRMGVSPTYVRKLARSLEGKGFLQRIARVGSTNAFDLQPLFKKVVTHAQTPAVQANRPRPRRPAQEAGGVRYGHSKQSRKQSQYGRREQSQAVDARA
jgi:hypothetical protein